MLDLGISGRIGYRRAGSLAKIGYALDKVVLMVSVEEQPEEVGLQLPGENEAEALAPEARTFAVSIRILQILIPSKMVLSPLMKLFQTNWWRCFRGVS